MIGHLKKLTQIGGKRRLGFLALLSFFTLSLGTCKNTGSSIFGDLGPDDTAQATDEPISGKAMNFFECLLNIDLELGVSPESIEYARRRFKTMVQKLKRHIIPGMTDENKLAAITAVIRGEISIPRLEEKTELLRLTSNLGSCITVSGTLRESEGVCSTLSLLYIALGRSLEMDIHGVSAPLHLFVRYEKGRKRINIELTEGGQHRSDDYYVKKFNIHATSLDKGVFLRSLPDEEMIAGYFVLRLQLTNLANKDSAVKLDSIVNSYPLMVYAYGVRAMLHRADGRLTKAAEDYRKALSLYPNWHTVHVLLASVKHESCGPDEALAYIDNVIEEFGSSPILTYGKGMILFDSGHYARSMEFLEAARKKLEQLETSEQVKLLLSGISEASYELGSYDKSLAAAKECVKVFPTYWRGRTNLGRAYLGLKNYTEALSVFQDALKLVDKAVEDKDTRELLLLAALGLTRTLANEHESSKNSRLLEKLDEVTKLCMDNLQFVGEDKDFISPVLQDRAYVLFLKKEYAEAFDLLGRLEKYNPIESLRGRAAIRIEQERYVEALKYLQQFHDLVPEDSSDKALATQDIKRIRELMRKQKNTSQE